MLSVPQSFRFPTFEPLRLCVRFFFAVLVGLGVGRPLTGRARVLARRSDVPSLQTYFDHSIDKHARLREQSRGCGTGTRSLPALGPAAAGLSLPAFDWVDT